MLGAKIKELREAKGLLQRQVAAELEVDTAYMSKVENDEKRASKSHLKLLARVLGVSEDELISLWLADKIMSLIEEEKVASKAVEIVQKQLKIISNKC
jgi:transcriptional regulator with XRE-family HTH domain